MITDCDYPISDVRKMFVYSGKLKDIKLRCLDFITFEKIFFDQTIFVSDRTINIKMKKYVKNEIYDTIPRQMYQPFLLKVNFLLLTVNLTCSMLTF